MPNNLLGPLRKAVPATRVCFACEPADTLSYAILAALKPWVTIELRFPASLKPGASILVRPCDI
jgi:hypothetical protein